VQLQAGRVGGRLKGLAAARMGGAALLVLASSFGALALSGCSCETEGPATAAVSVVRVPEPAAAESAQEGNQETSVPSPPKSSGKAVSDEARVFASDVLGDVVVREAGDPANAWALAHGMLALGPEFKARDGRSALRVLADDFLESDAFGPMFAKNRDGRPVEPHTDLILKTLLERGYGLDEVLKPGVTVGDLLRASRARFKPVRDEGGRLGFPVPNDAPWSVQSWCQAAASDKTLGWESQAGSVSIDEVALALLGKLEFETHFIRSAIARGESFEKRKQGIFAYTCGGAHLFQGAASCASLGWPKKGNSTKRIAIQVEQYLARFDVETGLVDQALRQNPQLAMILHNQDLKFLGHLIESLSKLERDGLWTPNSAELALLDKAEARLIANIIELKRSGAYSPAAMSKFAANPQVFQLYLDLVGDAAHALHGLKLRAELAKSR